MKPNEGRARVVIEEISPTIDGGRYPAKRVLGDRVKVTAAIFSDGHDHVAARLLYRHSSQKDWSAARFTPLVNDLWEAEFVPDKLGEWRFTVEAWVDHFDTWVHDLGKRLNAQPDPKEPTQQVVTPQDIPLALRIGAQLLQAAAARAKGTEDASTLSSAATEFLALADKNLPYYVTPMVNALDELARNYPDLSFSTKHPVEFPLWV